MALLKYKNKVVLSYIQNVLCIHIFVKAMSLIYTMHNKFSNFLGFASFLCSSLCSADQF